MRGLHLLEEAARWRRERHNGFIVVAIIRLPFAEGGERGERIGRQCLHTEHGREMSTALELIDDHVHFALGLRLEAGRAGIAAVLLLLL